MDDRTADPATLLAALRGQLDRRGYLLDDTDAGLQVSNPIASRTLSAIVTCEPRPEDGGRLWFFQRGTWDTTAEPAPVAEADHAHFAEALVILDGVLSSGLVQ